MTGWTKKMGNKDNKCDREGTSCRTIQKTTCDRGWIKTTDVAGDGQRQWVLQGIYKDNRCDDDQTR